MSDLEITLIGVCAWFYVAGGIISFLSLCENSPNEPMFNNICSGIGWPVIFPIALFQVCYDEFNDKS